MRACARQRSRSSDHLAALRGAERLEVPDQHRRLVQVHALDRQARQALGQVGRAREQALADRVDIQRKQFGRIVAAIPDQHFVLVGRVRGQRPDHGQAAVLGREHAGHVQHRLAPRVVQVQAHLRGDLVLLAQFEAEFEQLRLALAQQARQGDGGAHVGQGIVRGLVLQTVGAAQVFQAKTRLAVGAVAAIRCRRGAARRPCARRPADPSGRNCFAIRARTGRSGCARTESA